MRSQVNELLTGRLYPLTALEVVIIQKAKQGVQFTDIQRQVQINTKLNYRV